MVAASRSFNGDATKRRSDGRSTDARDQ